MARVSKNLDELKVKLLGEGERVSERDVDEGKKDEANRERDRLAAESKRVDDSESFLDALIRCYVEAKVERARLAAVESKRVEDSKCSVDAEIRLHAEAKAEIDRFVAGSKREKDPEIFLVAELKRHAAVKDESDRLAAELKREVYTKSFVEAERKCHEEAKATRDRREEKRRLMIAKAEKERWWMPEYLNIMVSCAALATCVSISLMSSASIATTIMEYLYPNSEDHKVMDIIYGVLIFLSIMVTVGAVLIHCVDKRMTRGHPRVASD